MDNKEIMKRTVQALLSSGSYDDLNNEQMSVVVDLETELWKTEVDELLKLMSPEEVENVINNWWLDYEIADGTLDNLLAYLYIGNYR